MAETTEEPVLPPVESGRSVRRMMPFMRWMRFGFLAAIGLLLLLVLAAIGLDSRAGHRFIVDQINAQRPATGLRIHVGRIDGSVWSRLHLHDVRFSDPKGDFVTIPHADLAWQPLGWAVNRLQIDRLIIPDMTLSRLPTLRPSGRQGPILPGFDIVANQIRIQKIRVGKAVAGAPRIASLEGEVAARKGRLLVDVDARSSGKDLVWIKIDAMPDANRFDANARINAPEGGIVGPILGVKRAFVARLHGKGDWTHWRGTARMQMGEVQAVDLALVNREGRFALDGTLAPSTMLSGKLMRLSAPTIAVKGNAKLENRRLSGAIGMKSAALAIEGRGTLNLGSNRFEQVQVDARLMKPPALFPNMSGRDIRLALRLDGAFATAAFDYLLSTPFVAFDATGFENVRIAGQGNLSASPVTLPVKMTASRVVGAGDVVGGILRNLSVNGAVRITGRQISGRDLLLRSDKLNGRLAVLIDLVTGKYDVSINAGMQRYLIPGLGLVDVLTELTVVPAPDGKGSQVAGRGRAWIRRFDNAFLRNLAGGLPEIDTGLSRGRDGVIHLVGLKLKAPKMTIQGTGYRRRDGTFFFEGTGSQSQYGAFAMRLDGRIDRPKLDFLFRSPNRSMNLSDVRLNLAPNAGGFAWRAEGQSALGPFQGHGQIAMASGQDTRIFIDDLMVTNTHGNGVLIAQTGGLAGTIALQGGGINGQLQLVPIGDVQQVKMALRASQAQFTGSPPVNVHAGRLEGTMLLYPDGPQIDATVTATGIRRGPISLARFAGNVQFRRGSGTVKASFAGARGRHFEIQSVAEISPDRWIVSAQGTVDRRPVRLANPAIFNRTSDGWRMERTALEFAGGRASLSGVLGDGRATVDADLERLPLTIADIVQPQLGLGGIATGRLHYVHPGKGGGVPQADLNLRIKGLTRSGLILSSRPVDAGVNLVLRGNALAARAIIANQDGKVIGRGQARIAPLGNAGTLMQRLSRAPLFAQLRYDGAADTLWRLTGVETIDLSGPVAIGADISGTVANPVIRGSMRSTKMRLESAVTGAVIENIASAGRFDGSRLVISQFKGSTGKSGSVSGQASFDLAAEKGFAMDIRADLDHAELVDRDDIGATITGPLTIRSDGSEGVISGQVVLDRSRYRLGRAASASIPTINVRERNVRDVEEATARPRMPWRYDLQAKARNRMMVTGLGLDSEWRANLTISGAVLNPVIGGEASLVRGGYEFAGRRFDLERGEIRFTGVAPPDPVLDIAANANVSGLNATIRVTGTGLRPDISFISTPALPEDELLARLLFGTSITNLSAPEAVQLAAAVAALNSSGGGINPINAVRKAAGLDRLRILPADVATGIGTSVAAGKYIGRRTFVEVISDGQGYSATRVEFQITRWLSLLSSVSTIGRQSANIRISKDY